jgi:hypothetical protein
VAANRARVFRVEAGAKPTIIALDRKQMVGGWISNQQTASDMILIR